jgi:hypothetical protein
MRKALNSNPLVQVGAIALLGVVVAFLMLTRMKGDDPPPPADAGAVPGADTASVAPAAGAPPSVGAPPAADAPAAAPAPSGEAAGPVGEFEAGPGLPKDVVKAYESGESVVVLVTREGGIDDAKLRSVTERLRGEGNVALFTAYARNVADYSRITEGVELDRVPALIALSPREASEGSAPVATISYGWRGYDSVRQAVRDAAYDGRDIPYHP